MHLRERHRPGHVIRSLAVGLRARPTPFRGACASSSGPRDGVDARLRRLPRARSSRPACGKVEHGALRRFFFACSSESASVSAKARPHVRAHLRGRRCASESACSDFRPLTRSWSSSSLRPHRCDHPSVETSRERSISRVQRADFLSSSKARRDSSSVRFGDAGLLATTSISSRARVAQCANLPNFRWRRQAVVFDAQRDDDSGSRCCHRGRRSRALFRYR